MGTLLPLIGLGLLVVSFGFVILFLIRTFRAYDKLIRYEYEHLPEQWEKDGQPSGMFWKPPEKKRNMYDRISARPTALSSAYTFVFSTPEWVKENPKPTAYIKEFRIYVLLWNIGVIVWFFAIFFTINSFSSLR